MEAKPFAVVFITYSPNEKFILHVSSYTNIKYSVIFDWILNRGLEHPQDVIENGSLVIGIVICMKY